MTEGLSAVDNATDISRSRFDLETLLNWLILTDPGRRSGYESVLNGIIPFYIVFTTIYFQK